MSSPAESDRTTAPVSTTGEVQQPANFIIDEVQADQQRGRFSRPICTRFPPEPNGYMHLGHAKAVTVGYGIAKRFNGLFNLRMDDTNPAAEKDEFVQAMERDVEWLLGHSLNGRVFHASDYYEQLYQWAHALIRKGLAFVCELSPEETRDYRGDYHKPGRPSPWRDRSVDENARLFTQMREGAFKPGSKVLRAKIDFNASNMNMRDPPIYRILDEVHHRAGNWHIYPLYDYAHPLSDAIEGITHSTCGKEFANHRPLYDWFLEKLDIKEPPRQIEFAEIGITGVVLGKRHLKKLVNAGLVAGWDDPRMPTISGFRRRGVPAEAIVQFCEELGVSNGDPGEVDIARLEHVIREHLNRTTPRVMGVVKPLKVVIENYPAGQVEHFEVADELGGGTRVRPFSREIFIEQSDFMEVPAKKYFRLAPGAEVRLRHAYFIKCTGVVKDPVTGAITELRATYDPETRGGAHPTRNVKGTLHWVSASHGLPVEVRLYDALFKENIAQFTGEQPIEDFLAPGSLEVARAIVEPSMSTAKVGERFQFERVGYFSVDPDSRPGHLVFNQTSKLKDNKFSKAMKEA